MASTVAEVEALIEDEVCHAEIKVEEARRMLDMAEARHRALKRMQALIRQNTDES